VGVPLLPMKKDTERIVLRAAPSGLWTRSAN